MNGALFILGHLLFCLCFVIMVILGLIGGLFLNGCGLLVVNCLALICFGFVLECVFLSWDVGIFVLSVMGCCADCFCLLVGLSWVCIDCLLCMRIVDLWVLLILGLFVVFVFECGRLVIALWLFFGLCLF